jgi:hypothetical protein
MRSLIKLKSINLHHHHLREDHHIYPNIFLNKKDVRSSNKVSLQRVHHIEDKEYFLTDIVQRNIPDRIGHHHIQDLRRHTIYSVQ